ncbi:hypothetical protein CC1G_12207 [Coprinopsis cinerea okayama7|uniref:Uncharacterized protein n=1 Tax=Coprinopsis cinerea (strain Okayama-7 / 130 / ATCC MYA-4618 / FGSC 9003) TaxID=240176 RepID=A8NKQ2_COPC7|nr:hypothetical protein CC1G_12207 [Coprinopsis cinerea okayama7\|eukprot:XP_001834518.2 hypothetical protein CC1G_12207 [Coprinopsis cinerea okayama7\
MQTAVIDHFPNPESVSCEESPAKETPSQNLELGTTTTVQGLLERDEGVPESRSEPPTRTSPGKLIQPDSSSSNRLDPPRAATSMTHAHPFTKVEIEEVSSKGERVEVRTSIIQTRDMRKMSIEDLVRIATNRGRRISELEKKIACLTQRLEKYQRFSRSLVDTMKAMTEAAEDGEMDVLEG